MQAQGSWSGSADDTLEDFPAMGTSVARRDSGVRSLDPGSGTRLADLERPTVRPGRLCAERANVVVERVRLHTSMDELLYRLAVGDWDGAMRANEELLGCVPRVTAGRIMLDTLGLDGTTEFVLAYVDGTATWGDIVATAPFEAGVTLRALCALVDEGVVSCV